MMISVFLVALLFGTAIQATQVLLAKDQGAKATDAHQYPWLLNLINATRTRERGYHNCGATLLRVQEGIEKSDMVLTAAHCVAKQECPSAFINRTLCVRGQTPREYQKNSDLAIIAGNHRLNETDDGEQRFSIEKMLYYGKIGVDGDDIALIKLSTPITFSKTIQPIDISKKGDIIKDESICAVAGWGGVGGKTHPEELHHLNVTIKSEITCFENFLFGYDHEKRICATTEKGLTGICHGDSGSPLFCKSDNTWTMYGVVNGGRDSECGAGTEPGLYARVSYYADWIEKQTRAMSSLWPKNAKTRLTV